MLALQRLDHPNVMRLLAVSTHGSNLVLVLPFLPGSLAALLAAQPAALPEGEAATLARELFSGLAACHAAGVVHRDIKPPNLLLSASGELRIGDFGQARLLAPPGEPMSHAVATRWYRAPALLLGAKLYGAAVDMWAAGCTVAQCWSLSPLVPLVVTVAPAA